MRLSSLAATASAAVLMTAAGVARSQSTGGFALNHFDPAPAGDVFFGVPSPFAAGDFSPRSLVLFDYANAPIRISGQDTAVVSSQAYLHFNASLALFDRLLVSANMPLLIAQSGDDPGITGTTFTTLEAPQAGDLRLGARVRLLGEDSGPFQLGVGGYFYVPTGNQEQYSGEGAVRGALQASAGGRLGTNVGFVWSAFAGAELTGGDTPQALTYGAGAGVLLAQDLLQLGPELYASTPLGGDLLLSSNPVTSDDARTTAELLFGAKLRIFGGFTIGAAAGPGLLKAVGTPVFRAIGTIGWAPLPPSAAEVKQEQQQAQIAAEQVRDTDDDGIADKIDACPSEKGEPSPDPKRDGCPPLDRDSDSVLDVDDACPTTAGVRNGDVTKNGCPTDTDGDGYHDGIDACPTIVGDASSDSKRNGCPGDKDDDGIPDAKDGCKTAKGPANPDPKFNGCPEDPDGDGFKYAKDACPNEKGPAHPDPKQNGCPKFVRVTTDEILTSKPVQFRTNGATREETIDPLSDDLLHEVRDAINNNPDIELVEVQGHTDDEGTEDYNMKLSQTRANAVRDWLVKGGVPASKVVAKGYGFEAPLGDNRVKTGRQKNRRVQFMIIQRKQR